MAAPYQVKFCYALQEYFDVEMWFYTHLEANRPDWWAIPLGDKCKVLKGSRFIPILNYSNAKLLGKVKAFKPDIILAGGFFFPSQYRVKNWAIRNDIKYIAFGERISFERQIGIVKVFKKWVKKISIRLYSDIDLFLAMGEKPYVQITEDFGFPKNKVVLARYPQDIDRNFNHELRNSKTNPRIIFPNRLDQSYNPLFALKVFKAFNHFYPESTFMMNSSGELRRECEAYINSSFLNGKVIFLENIKNWDELPDIYKQADIALFTATDSNGPNALIECMASAMGVVVSDKISNISEYAVHEHNCFISTLSVDKYVDYLVKFVSEKDLLTKYGVYARAAVKERSIKDTAKLYYEIISKLYL